MKTYHIKDPLKERLENVTLTMGNFDGVHKGHQRLLRLTLEKARKRAGQAVVLTFDPHPVQLFKPGTFQMIQSLDDRIERLQRSAVDVCIVLEFTRDLADHEPREFLDKYILSMFDLKETVVGYDTTFGRRRQGTPEVLAAFGRELNFETTTVDPVMVGDTPVSSSRIRKAVAAGNIQDANDLLGYTYRLTGTVVKGYGRGGALLSFPTANIQSNMRLLPSAGVYAVWVCRRGELYRGACNIGVNPTFGNDAVSVEVYILDFDEDIYGEQITLRFQKRLREEQHFENIDALIAQMKLDVEEVRRVLR